MSGDLETTPTDRLKTLIHETEERLQDLRAELDRREQARQHEAIDHLEDYIDAAEVRLRPLKDLIVMIVDELRAKKKPDGDATVR